MPKANSRSQTRMKSSFNFLLVVGISVVTAATATPVRTAEECRDLIGNLDPEGVDPMIVRSCTQFLMEGILRGT
jgi:hypothetical protein